MDIPTPLSLAKALRRTSEKARTLPMTVCREADDHHASSHPNLFRVSKAASSAEPFAPMDARNKSGRDGRRDGFFKSRELGAVQGSAAVVAGQP